MPTRLFVFITNNLFNWVLVSIFVPSQLSWTTFLIIPQTPEPSKSLEKFICSVAEVKRLYALLRKRLNNLKPCPVSSSAGLGDLSKSSEMSQSSCFSV